MITYWATTPIWSNNKTKLELLAAFIEIYKEFCNEQTDTIHVVTGEWKQWPSRQYWSVGRLRGNILHLSVLFSFLYSLHHLLSLIPPALFSNSHYPPQLLHFVALAPCRPFAPPSSHLNPATPESHFIPPQVYLPFLSVHLALTHFLVFSLLLSFLLIPLSKSHLSLSLLYLSRLLVFVYLTTLSLLKLKGPRWLNFNWCIG